MFHPMGSQPPAVYWRRRLVFAATLLVVAILIIVTARVVLGSEDTGAAGGLDPGGPPTTSRSTPTTTPRTQPATSKSTPRSSTSAPSSDRGSTGNSSSKPAPRTSAAPVACTPGHLEIRAVVDHSTYSVGDKPNLTLQVTNTGSAACVQDLADAQIVLLVYNGESRVWGSHDCKVLPGTSERTLAPGAPVRVTVVWSGLSSEPGCAATRQLVGAGTYTLYAKLAGKTGQAAQFAIS